MVATSARRPGRTHSAYVRHPAGVPRPVGEWRIYRWWGFLPRESGWWRRFLAWLLGGWQVLLYLGETERLPMVRALEHALDKSWIADAHTLEVDRRIWWSAPEVLAYEAAAIKRERPVHNIAHNGDNPGAVARRRRHLPQHVVLARLRYAAYAALWLVCFVGLWVAARDVWHGWDGPRNAAVGASVLLGLIAGRRVSVWWRRVSRPRRRRR